MISGESTRPMQVWDGRASMRTLADALAKFEEMGGFSDGDDAEIRIGLMQLPDGAVAGTVVLIGPDKPDGCGVALPTSVALTANDTFGDRHRYDIDELDRATCDLIGNVQLRDGSYVHAVEFEPARLVAELTMPQEALLRCVLKVLGCEKQCLRPVHEELLPGLMLLDYAAIAELGTKELPSLKAIERDVLKEHPEVSRQTLANVLALAGLRRPRSGARARRKANPPLAATVSP